MNNINKNIDGTRDQESIIILEYLHDLVHEHSNEGLKDAVTILDNLLNVKMEN